MSTTGKIKILFSDKEKTEALFPRTKTSAVSSDDGTGLNVILDNLSTELESKATEAFVTNKIAEAQLSGGGSGDIDLSGYATKDELRNIDFPVDSVNGKTGAISLSYGDVGAAASSHTHTKSQITDFPTSMPASDVYAWAKASSKPSYSWSEITYKPSDFTPAYHTQAASTITGMTDYVIAEQNTPTLVGGGDQGAFWTWRKWASGRVEMWGFSIPNETMNINTAWGNVLESGRLGPYAYPITLQNTSSNRPIGSIQLYSSNVGLWFETAGWFTNISTPSIWAIRPAGSPFTQPTQEDPSTFYVHCYVTGFEA